MQYEETTAFKDQIDGLNADAWRVRVSDSVLACELSQQALAIAEQYKYVKGIAESLRTIGFCYIRFSKHEEAATYLERALPLLQEIHYEYGESDVYEYFGIIKRSLGDYHASLKFLYKSLKLREEIGYHEGRSLALYHLGVTYKYLGNFEQALDNFMNSLSIARLYNFRISESYSLNNIGLIYFETLNYTTAQDYFNQSLIIRRKTGDKWGEAGCLDNMGFCYLKMQEYEKAISFCNQSLEICLLTGDQKGNGNSVFHLGNIYEELTDFDNALMYYNKSLQVRQRIKDKKGEAEILLFMAEVYTKDNFQQRDTSKALALMNEALKIGNEIGANDLLAKIHYGLYSVYKKNNLDSQALEHLEKNLNIEKQVHSNTINKKILNIEIAHYEKEIIELEAKALQSQMNPHFIFNCMNSIKALIQEHDEDKAITYLTTFSKLMRTILNNSEKREISLFDEIETCRLYTQLESMRFENKFQYNFFIDETVDMKSIFTPALIIQPFIENAIWHGIMPKENGGSLNISVKNEQEAVCCVIDDNGIGREMSKQNKFQTDSTHNSKGMHLTQTRINLDNLINNRNASLEIIDKKDEADNATGTKVILVFKKY